jgi:lipoprotein
MKKAVLIVLSTIVLISGCGKNELLTNNKSFDIEKIKSEVKNKINIDGEITSEYLSDSAYYIETDNKIIRVQLDIDGNIGDYIEYKKIY